MKRTNIRSDLIINYSSAVLTDKRRWPHCFVSPWRHRDLLRKGRCHSALIRSLVPSTLGCNFNHLKFCLSFLKMGPRSERILSPIRTKDDSLYSVLQSVALWFLIPWSILCQHTLNEGINATLVFGLDGLGLTATKTAGFIQSGLRTFRYCFVLPDVSKLVHNNSFVVKLSSSKFFLLLMTDPGFAKSLTH